MTESVERKDSWKTDAVSGDSQGSSLADQKDSNIINEIMYEDSFI